MKATILALFLVTVQGCYTHAKEVSTAALCRFYYSLYKKYESKLDSLSDQDKLKGWSYYNWYQANCTSKDK